MRKVVLQVGVDYRSQGQYTKAEPLFCEVLKRQRRRLGDAQPHVAVTPASLALTLLRQRKYAGAETLLGDCWKIREPQQPDAWETL
jgi:hypothetical protein